MGKNCKINQERDCLFSTSSRFCETLDRIGVPDEPHWRSLILYMRSLSNYDYLTDVQKAKVQALVMDTLKRKDFSAAKFKEVIFKQERIVNAPYRQKLNEALSETATAMKEFKGMLTRRKGEVKKLEDSTVEAVENLEEPAEVAQRIKGMFKEVLTTMERDEENLIKLSLTDPLTNLANRRALDDRLGSEINTAKLDSTPLSLLMIDIDHFKNFNDRHGHLIGDQALATVAKILNQVARDPDFTGLGTIFPARYGGEEFAVVLPGRNIDEAVDVAEEIRSRIERYNFLIRDGQGNVVEKNIKITVSVGAAQYTPKWLLGADERLIDSADKALYKAKDQGRNLVCEFND